MDDLKLYRNVALGLTALVMLIALSVGVLSAYTNQREEAIRYAQIGRDSHVIYWCSLRNWPDDCLLDAWVASLRYQNDSIWKLSPYITGDWDAYEREQLRRYDVILDALEAAKP